jgi:predicted nucleic acid-binding protein
MLIEEVVIDASPLISLFRSQQADLLAQLFTNIWVPKAVWQEVTESEHEDSASQGLVTATWPKIVHINQIPDVISKQDLGKGESEVLSFAINSPKVRAMLDDHAARRCAKTLGISTLGTGGMLVLAKQRGIIPSVGEAIEALRTAGMFLSDDLVQLLTTKAGESNLPMSSE